MAPLGREAVSEMHKLFDWAQASRLGRFFVVTRVFGCVLCGVRSDGGGEEGGGCRPGCRFVFRPEMDTASEREVASVRLPLLFVGGGGCR